MRALWRDEDGAWRTTLRGRQVLADPRINKGTAFGDSERRDLGLTGLVPAAHFTLDDQVARVYAQYRHQPDDLDRNVTLNALHDRNEVLFYRLLTDHLRRCCRSSTHRRSGRRSRITAMSTGVPAGSTCRWTTPN